VKEIPGSVKNQGNKKRFLFSFFLYHIFVVKVPEIAWSASYGENKTQNPKQTNKGDTITNHLHKGPYQSLAHIRAQKSKK